MLGGETKSSLVKAAAGKELAARGECHTVHRLLMPAEDRSGSKCKRVTLLVRVESISNLLVNSNLVKVWTQVPFSTSHSRTVESKLAEAST